MKNNKQIIKMNESQLRNFIGETIKDVLKENITPDEDYIDDDDIAYAEEVDGNPDLMLGHLYSKMSESQLRQFVSETIKNVLKETTDNATDVYTVDAYDIDEDEGLDYMPITGQIYYSEDDAINAARNAAKNFTDFNGNVIIFTVYAGEKQMANGDIYGEPYDIYSISNSDEQTTIQARKRAGYSRLEVDEYMPA